MLIDSVWRKSYQTWYNVSLSKLYRKDKDSLHKLGFESCVFWCFSTDQLIIEFTTDQYQAQSLVIECVMIWSVLIYSGITGQFDLSPIWTMSMHILLNPLILTLFCLTTASLKSFFSFLLKNITWYVLQVTRGLWESAWQMVSFKLLVCHVSFYTTWYHRQPI